MNKGFVFLLFSMIVFTATAQKNVRDSLLNITSIGGHFGFNVPFADLGKRFGLGEIAGGSLLYKTKSNLTLETNFSLFYGNKVKEDSLLKNITTSQGYVLNVEGSVIDVIMYERGFNVGVRIGKIIPVIGPNPNSGLHAQFGLGLMQHRIKYETYFEAVPQLMGDYKKGYDKLTNGIALMQSLGYQHFSNKRLINYYIGLELYEGFTRNRRSIDFTSGIKDNKQRLDLLTCLTVKWYFPLYKRRAKDFYFY